MDVDRPNADDGIFPERFTDCRVDGQEVAQQDAADRREITAVFIGEVRS